MNPKDEKYLAGAIKKLRPGAQFAVSGREITWMDKRLTQPSWSEIEQVIPEVKAECQAKHDALVRELQLRANGVTDRTKLDALWAMVADGNQEPMNEIRRKIEEETLKHGGK